MSNLATPYIANFDGVTPPALPADWVTAGSGATTAAQHYSGVNALVDSSSSATQGSGPSGLDGCSGLFTASVKVLGVAYGSSVQSFIVFRCNVAPNLSSPSWVGDGTSDAYYAKLIMPSTSSSADGQLQIVRRYHGSSATQTQIINVQWMTGVWYNVIISAGSAVNGIQVQVQAMTGTQAGNWLNSSGAWVTDVSGTTVALTLIETTPAANVSAGYFRLIGYQSTWYFDDFSLTALALVPPVITMGVPSLTQINGSASAALSGSGSYTYQWYRGTSPDNVSTLLTGQTTLTLADTTAAANTRYWYTCQVNDGLTIATSAVSLMATLSSAPGNLVIAFGGDSWIQANGNETNGTPNMATVCCERLEQLYGYRAVTSVLISPTYYTSKQSSDWISNSAGLTALLAAATSANATDFVLMIGFNDARAATPTTKAAYKSNVQSTANAAVAAGLRVTLIGPQIATDVVSTPACVAAILGYQAACSELANGTTILDGGHALSDWFARQPQITGEWGTSGYHPNVAGVQMAGALLAQGFSEAVGIFSPATQAADAAAINALSAATYDTNANTQVSFGASIATVYDHDSYHNGWVDANDAAADYMNTRAAERLSVGTGSNTIPYFFNSQLTTPSVVAGTDLGYAAGQAAQYTTDAAEVTAKQQYIYPNANLLGKNDGTLRASNIGSLAGTNNLTQSMLAIGTTVDDVVGNSSDTTSDNATVASLARQGAPPGPGLGID